MFRPTHYKIEELISSDRKKCVFWKELVLCVLTDAVSLLARVLEAVVEVLR